MTTTNKMTRTEILARGFRARRVLRLADTAEKMGCDDVADFLRCNLETVCATRETCDRELGIARAALLLVVFEGEDEDEIAA